jgi:glycosyltransferase involved in cell wall biosynthesis
VSRLVMVVPADLDRPTGGNRYDRALAGALGELGVEVEQRPAPGRWPVATPADRDRLAGLLQAAAPVLVDGLLACGAPEAVAGAVAAGARVYVLVHLPLALDSGLSAGAGAELDELERQALQAATGVLATSLWTAAELRDRHAISPVAVAEPGTDLAPAATGSSPPRLLHLAAVTPLKDQLGVVEALALIQDRPWTADLTGSLDVDPGYTERVRTAIDRHRLGDRVRLTGPLTGAALGSRWAAADLLLLPSHTETWGMAVTEALAHGIPAIVGRGTGAEHALGRAPDGTVPGAAVPPGDPVALAAALRDLLGPGREQAITAARARSHGLRRWRDTAQDVLAVVR